MTLSEINYIESELFAVAPVPLDNDHFPYGFNLQIRSERGQTKWLNITPAQQKKIEAILLGAEN